MKKRILLEMALLLFFGLSAQTYEDITPSSFVQGVGNNCSSASGDINGDNSIDIILTGVENSSALQKTWLYLNDGSGNFTLSTNSGISMGFIYSDIDLGDYDADGDLDIVVQGWDLVAEVQTQRAYVYKNDGAGTFALVDTLIGRSNGSIEFGDYDNDGLLDILQTGWKADVSTGKTTIYHNDGNDVFTDINDDVIFDLADGQARFGDYDNDGNLDIIVNGWMQAHIYKGDGTGQFVNQNISLPTYDYSYVDFIDYNQDGFKDVLIGGHYYDEADYYATKVLKGNGTNVFTEMDFGLTNVQRGPVKTGDCNSDGKTDFFVSGWGGSGVFQIFVNDGTDTLYNAISSINDVIAGWADGTMQVADFNGNGNDDVFKCGWNLTKLYSNTKLPTEICLRETDDFSVFAVNNTLNVTTSYDGKNTIKLYDITGKFIVEYSFVGTTACFSLPNMPKGIYVVLNQGQRQTSQKLIIE